MSTNTATAKAHVDLDNDTAEWLTALIEARKQRDEWDRVVERATDKIKHALGEAEEGHVDGRVAVRWTFVDSSRIDVKKLEAEHPDIAEAFRVPTTTRRFSVVDK